MRHRSAAASGAVLVAALMCNVGDRALACGGEGPLSLHSVDPVWPADDAAFARGRIGVVQPTYAREFLAKAYRRFTGVVVGIEAQRGVTDWQQIRAPGVEWLKAREGILRTGSPIDDNRIPAWRSSGYLSYVNCTGDALRTATATLKARAAEYGAAGPEVNEWLAAQDQVFANCGDAKQPVVPVELPADAPAPRRADRAYQIAAAQFYAGQFGEAQRRFRAIGQDSSSPWRDYGRFLAARCLIREATLVAPDHGHALELMKRADEELRSVGADPSLARVHKAARQLRAFVGIRIDPVRRAHELSAVITASAQVEQQDWVDFVWVMDLFLNQFTQYPYATIKEREALAANDDLIDWILAMQGTGDQAAARALSRWQQTRALHWLIAALWKVSRDSADAPELLAAAARVPRDSPGYHTIAFLRVRALTALRERDAARDVLATVSTTPDDRTPTETSNLYRAQALLLARSLDELLTNIPRKAVGDDQSYGAMRSSDPDSQTPMIDYDGSLVLSEKLPLARLVEALRPKLLPDWLRREVAAMVFVRSVILRRDDAGVASATVLRDLYPAMASDVERYLKAANAESRHRAGIFLIVRRARISAVTWGVMDGPVSAWPPDVDDGYWGGGIWWCAIVPERGEGASSAYDSGLRGSFLPGVASMSGVMPHPEFLTATERAGLRAELDALSATGTAPNYLLGEAVRWARARRTDPMAAEALARAIRTTRWACGDDQTAAYARTAFEVLHTVFPTSEWTKRTRYWYDGRNR